VKSFAEFFAGVGLVNEGLEPHGWKCTWANDISANKQETYIANYGGDEFWLGDIWDVAKTPNMIEDDVFLYTASFPCTDLSVAGARAGLAGAESGTLHALIEILSQKRDAGSKPKVVLLENVRGFLTSNDGLDVAETVRLLNSLDYRVDIIDLDAIHFSAQSRPRVFVIAVDNTLAPDVMVCKGKINILDSWWSYFDKSPIMRTEKIRKIILANPHLEWGLFDIKGVPVSDTRLIDIVETDESSNSLSWWNDERKAHIHSQMNDRHLRILEEMIAGDNYSYGTVYRRMRKGKSMAELRTDGYAGCLRTPKGGSSKQIVIQAGKGDWKVRLLTPREYARLQGVRDSFILPDNANKGYYAMGDAVCVPVIEFIAEQILNPVYEAAQKSEPVVLEKAAEYMRQAV